MARRVKKPPLDLSEFETRVHIRQLHADDYERLIEMQADCFPGMQTWAKEQIESQIATFPEGQLVIEYDGDIVASSASLIVDFHEYEDWHDWKVIADSGYIRNHDPEGDTLYGIEIMVDPEFRGHKLARRLYEARRNLAREKNLRRSIIGGRIPNYHKHADHLSAREYVEEVLQKNIYDPVLTTQLANGFRLVKLIPNYFPSDTDSCGYATFLEWVNLDHVEEGARKIQAVHWVRLCLVQYRMRSVESFEEFAKQASTFVDLASDYKSDFVVFPELFTTQLLSIVDAPSPSVAARKLAEYSERYLELFTDMAVSYNINIIGGSQFVVEDDRLFNVSYLFRRDGTIGKQYKIHITPNERKWWGVNPGRKVEVFDTDRGKIAILICYDIEFPELARVATAKGAKIIFVPFNTDERYSYLRVRHCAQARAIENQIYTAIAGCAGIVPFVDNADLHYAQCGIFTPSDFPFARDAVASESMPNIETIVVHDVDLELLRKNRQSGTVRPWTDRMREIYSVKYEDPDEGTIEC
ncbi:MAG: bifunctional GNAT family N-acetyltransferase/carbon-nitrogen hydrolase family protein [Planctomycetes bacterium]|nr:bifunctional GNAT family N-acetyltransferase/carbon-nitrogen hydrolase family protein [Planctomycetota bacterium]